MDFDTTATDRNTALIDDYKVILEDLKKKKHHAFRKDEIYGFFIKLEEYYNSAFPKYDPKDSNLSEEKQQELSYLESEIVREMLNERL